jgi:hypothetical protein
MTYCIVDGAYTSACWVCDTAEDFEFHHNIITNSNYVWIRSNDNKRIYNLHDCIITNNKIYSGYNTGPGFNLVPTDNGIIYNEKNVIKDGMVQYELGQGIDHKISRDFLHVKKGTFGNELGAGIFINQ